MYYCSSLSAPFLLKYLIFVTGSNLIYHREEEPDEKEKRIRNLKELHDKVRAKFGIPNTDPQPGVCKYLCILHFIN
jgi:hypothetical protein